jgi:hypothetical protein
MADNVNTNPILITEAGTVWAGKQKRLILAQWIDDNEDIADSSTLVLTINGVVLTTIVQLDADDVSFKGAVVWQIGPFSRGIPLDSFVVTTMAEGHLHIWHE